jgi:hypothetical protein
LVGELIKRLVCSSAVLVVLLMGLA